MAIGINGTVAWQFQPLDYNNTNLAGAFWNDRSNYLKSANDSFRFQVIWTSSGVNEGVEPSQNNWTGSTPSAATGNGDVVNIVFTIYTTTDYHLGSSFYDWEKLGVIKKSRDIGSKRYQTGASPAGHRFTVDISQLLSDELSYSLCPINKGTWQSNYYGGMNGGLTIQDNVLAGTGAMGTPVSNYNVSDNGTFRGLRVTADYEVINGAGKIVTATGGLESNHITAINSVNQFERDGVYYYHTYNMSNNAERKYKYLSRCPNFSDSGSGYELGKPVRVDEAAEYLQFFILRADSYNINTTDDTVGGMGLKVETFLADGSAENTFYVRDFEDNALTEVDGSGRTIITSHQRQMFVQNVSPFYLNNTAVLKAVQDPIDHSAGAWPYWNSYTGDKITSSTHSYRVSMSRFGMYTPYTERRTTKYRHYTIDREEDNIPYGFVRFHWLNSLGGIDSYTAKRDVVEGLTISRSVVERKSRDRTWYQDDENQGVALNDGIYISDTMRGGDIYKGGREVSNVNVEKTQSVYTEPLNKSMAKWLEEIITSPNVWIEMETEATKRGNTMNPYLRPSDKEYIPIIITNSDVETVNQAEGLVRFNITKKLINVSKN